MSSIGELATQLRHTTDDDLLRGLAFRHAAPSGIRDFFDLAEQLLSTSSLEGCLTRLDRSSLASLTQLGEGPASVDVLRTTHGLSEAALAHLRSLFLVNGLDGRLKTWPEVKTQLANWPELDSGATPASAAEPRKAPLPANTRTATDHAAAERAFSATITLTELIFTLEREPVPLLANRTVGRPALRRLAELLHVDELTVNSFIDVGRSAGLITRTSARLVASDSHEEWLALDTAERWTVIADAWISRHCADIRVRLGEIFDTVYGPTLVDWLTWNYPGGREWLSDERDTRLREAELLGVTAHHIIGSPAALLLRGETGRASTSLASALPTPIDKIYLQHDLTAVAPGPLQPAIDTRLRTMADVDGHSIAARFRFTRESVTRAISRDETAASMLEFLTSITLTGVPQPLEYLIRDTASRHGLLRVGTVSNGGPQSASYVRSEDPVLLRTVLVDRNMAVLVLRPMDDGRLVSPRDREQLYSVLHDAQYPVAAEDSNGHIIAPHRRTTSKYGVDRSLPRRTTTTATHPLHSLIHRLRAADASAPDDAGQAWFARQLDAAIRSKSTVTVSVRMPNGTIVDYRLEPASVAGGRLRARDPLSEIERTLPLSSIAAVTLD